MKKKLLFVMCFVLAGLGNFLQLEEVDAKSVSTRNTSILEHDTGGSNYAYACLINVYGTIFYDMDQISTEYQPLVLHAADSWNQTIGRKVLVPYQESGVEKENVDMRIESHEGGSYLDYSISGVGYGHSAGILKIHEMILNPNCVPGSPDYAKAVSTIRHEMGHALGLRHDYGMVMADLGSGQIDGDQQMIDAGWAMLEILNQGILPDIPSFNRTAILYLLNNRQEIYSIPNHRPNQIASIFLDSPHGKIAGVTFPKNKTATINKNFNLYKLSLSPADPFVGTTAGHGLVNKTITVKEDLISIYNYHYYLFEIDGEEYIVNAWAFE